MSEDNQDQLKTTRPGVHIKHSALDAHTLASDNIRKDIGNVRVSDPSLSDLVAQAEKHEQAVSILGRDEQRLPGESKSIIPQASHGLTAQEAYETEVDIPTYMRKEKQNKRKKLKKALEDPNGGTASSLDPINFGDMEKGEPTREITQEDVKPTDNN